MLMLQYIIYLCINKQYYWMPDTINNMHLNHISFPKAAIRAILKVMTGFKEVCSYLKSNFHWIIDHIYFTEKFNIRT